MGWIYLSSACIAANAPHVTGCFPTTALGSFAAQECYNPATAEAISMAPHSKNNRTQAVDIAGREPWEIYPVHWPTC